jgi:hypothetical protein
MFRTFVVICAVVGLLAVTGIALADELKGTIDGKPDTDKMTFKVKVDDKDTVVKWTKDTKFVGGKGGTKDLDEKAVKDGAKVTVTYEKKDGDAVIATKVQFGKK